MKKLTKLNINPEKVMKYEELVTLRGGYDFNCGSGWTSYMCEILACEGCTLFTAPACVPSSESDVRLYVIQHAAGGILDAYCWV
jgi:hypothetical protein